MGLVARAIRWLWKRWSDYQSVVAILDILDLKTAIGGLLGFIGMTLFGATNMQWSPPAVILAGLVAGALVSVILVATRLWWALGSRAETSVAKSLDPTTSPAAHDGDIDARAAFFRILDGSQWRADQDAKTDTKNLVYDWREVRLSIEIHRLLRNGRLASWGEECLPGTNSTPEKPIPPEVWDRVAIHFDRSSAPRTAAHFKGRTSRELGNMAWVAVKFSSEQIFGLFPMRPASPIDRISMVELLKIATELGWNFTDQHSLELIDLQDAIRQGALDGRVTVWGKRNRWPNAPQLMRKEVLEKISPDHFKEFMVNIFGALEKDNFHVYTWHMQPSGAAERSYLDLNVSRVEATQWLSTDAAEFKGRTTTQNRV
ncbi:hypothetical protein ABID58_000697 [Bradyrhizobium sp. S3.2.6]|uniref:hypothetical protein n=1 Tax=Bradyrhizobium sp. S3.2.6 TaxID=3156428 RepID=UPI0033911303